MGLPGAVSCIVPGRNTQTNVWGPDFAYSVTARGVIFPDKPRPQEWELSAFRWAEGAERDEGW
jgi:hypothetical protein